MFLRHGVTGFDHQRLQQGQLAWGQLEYRIAVVNGSAIFIVAKCAH